MGYDAVHTASSTGDDQEIRRCIEGLDVDRDGLFNRHEPQPRVIVGRPPGSHGRFNKPIPAAIRGSLGDTPLHKVPSSCTDPFRVLCNVHGTRLTRCA